MPNTGKNARGNKRMSKSGTARRIDESKEPDAQPLLGEAALKATVAELGAGPRPADASPANPEAGHLPAKTVSQVFGEIAWLMTQSPRHKTIALGDLEWVLMPAILLQQFRIFYKGEQPVGVVLWALVDDAVAKRIDASDHPLAAAEWKCGTHKRIVDVVAPFGGEAEMRKMGLVR